LQAVVKDRVVVSVPFLGGINEDLEVFNLPLEEFRSVVGTFPNFHGILARCPGKAAIRYETSPIRAVHQSFAVGSFCFYIEADRLLLYNECANPRYTVKPTPPTDLGTNDDGLTLDVFGGTGFIPLNVPDLSFSPKCIPQGDAPTPDPDPEPAIGAGSYILKTEFFNNSPAIVVFGFQHGGIIDSSYQFEEGVDFTVGVGETFDFSSYVEAEKADLELIEVSESVETTPLSVVSTAPTGAVEIQSGNQMVLTGANTWSESIATVQIETSATQYSIDTTNFPTDISNVNGFTISFLNSLGSGPAFNFILGTDFDVGDVIDLTSLFAANLTPFGLPLDSVRFDAHVTSLPFVELPMTKLAEDPASNFQLQKRGVLTTWELFIIGSTDWPDIVQLQLGFT